MSHLHDFNQQATRRDAIERRSALMTWTLIGVGALVMFVLFVVLELPA